LPPPLPWRPVMCHQERAKTAAERVETSPNVGHRLLYMLAA